MARKTLSYKTARHKKRSSRFLPVFGLLLAVLLGIVAYILAPYMVDYAMERNANVNRQFTDFADQYGEDTIDYLAAGVFWLILLGLATLFVAIFVGSDPETDSLKDLGPSPANKKAVVKQLKKDLREAQKRAKQKQRQQGKKK